MHPFSLPIGVKSLTIQPDPNHYHSMSIFALLSMGIPEKTPAPHGRSSKLREVFGRRSRRNPGGLFEGTPLPPPLPPPPLPLPLLLPLPPPLGVDMLETDKAAVAQQPPRVDVAASPSKGPATAAATAAAKPPLSRLPWAMPSPVERGD
jgi:hypothetical protein